MDTTAAAAPVMTLASTRFGSVAYGANELIRFSVGLPGFPDLRQFLPLALEEQAPYMWLQSVDEPAVALPVIDPWQLFADYDPRLPAATIDALEISGADDFVVLVVVVAEPGGDRVSVNLLAPIVINVKRGEGRQVALDDRRYSVRTNVPRTPPAAVQAAG